MRRLPHILLVTAVTAVILPVAARAQSPAPAPADVTDFPAAAPATDAAADTPAIGLSEAAVRVRWIQERLQAADRRLDIWTWGWTLGFAGLTLGQVVMAETATEEGPRAQAVAGALGSTLGLAGMAITPVRRVLDHAEAAARLDPDDPAALAEAERLLAEVAAHEREGFAWANHVLAIAVAGAGAAAIWKAWPDDHPREALMHLGSSLVVGELQLFTQPRRGVRDLAAYERGDWAVPATAARPKPQLHAGLSAGGLTLGLRF
jgi:hypothetical protein